ncbi:MAG TPA: hypothetical protein DDW50_19630 [Firmicutes bacterium]|jgi:hypothetical protein|nr:hypothetical protein [Bacillota bacterium]
MGIEKLFISMEEKSALVELQKNLITDYGVEELVAFGSGVKEGSGNEMTYGGIPDLLAKINQDFHSRFTMLIFDKVTWENWAGQNLYKEIKKDGVQIW